MNSVKYFSISNRQESDQGTNSMLDQLKSEISGETNDTATTDGHYNEAQNDSAGSGEKF